MVVVTAFKEVAMKFLLCFALLCFANVASAQITNVEVHGQMEVIDLNTVGESFDGELYIGFDGQPKGVLTIKNSATGNIKKVKLASLTSGDQVWDHVEDDPGYYPGQHPFVFTVSGGNIEGLRIGGEPMGLLDWFEINGAGHSVIDIKIQTGA
jgi:hypothetical protein